MYTNRKRQIRLLEKINLTKLLYVNYIYSYSNPNVYDRTIKDEYTKNEKG